MPRAATLAAVLLLVLGCATALLAPTDPWATDAPRVLEPGPRSAWVLWHRHHHVNWLGCTYYGGESIAVHIRPDLPPDEVRRVIRHELLHVIGAHYHYTAPNLNILFPALVSGDDTAPGPGDLWIIQNSPGTWTIYSEDATIRAASEWACAYWNGYAGRVVFVVKDR